MKSGWATVSFAEAVEDVTGGHIKTKQADYLPAGRFPIVDQGRELVGGFTDDPSALSPVELPVILFGDHTRCVKYVDFRFGAGADGVKVLRPRPGVDARYLYYVIRSTPIHSAGYSRHFKFLKEVDIPLPPIDEQQRIAAVLDAADALRAKRRQALDRLDTLTHAIFIDMFGDPVSNPMGWRDSRVLGDVADIRSGITKGREVGDAPLAEVPFLAVVNVQDGAIVLDPLKTIEATPSELDRFALRAGDVLLTEGGDPDKLGRGAVWDGRLDPCLHQNHVFRVRVTDAGLTPEYLSRLIGSPRGKRYFLRMAKQTTGIASINMTQLRSFPILEPPIELQYSFLTRLSELEQLSARSVGGAAGLDKLFASLQQRAFRGQL